MTTWNNEIVRIESVVNHPNADKLDIVTVLGDYPVITKRDEYKANDIATYISIDSIVPDTEQFYFLCPLSYEKYIEDDQVKHKVIGKKYNVGEVPEKYRIIKAKSIRSKYSQGLLVPAVPGLNVGDSVVEHFNLIKWEEPEDIPQHKKVKGANALAGPKDWSLPYYDIEGLRKHCNLFESFDEEIVVSEKFHGANATFCFDGIMWCKSRNFFKRFNEDDTWWDIAIRYNLQEKLSKYPNLAFFGEILGVQKGYLYDTTIFEGNLLTTVKFFDIYDTKNNCYLNYDKFVEIIKDLDLPMVTELYKGKWPGKDIVYQMAEGKSTIAKHLREGIVIKSTKETYNDVLRGRMQCKLIGEGYNLAK